MMKSENLFYVRLIQTVLLVALQFSSIEHLYAQYRFGEYQSTVIPDYSIEISRTLNARYEENLKTHRSNRSMLNVLYDYQLTPEEVGIYNYCNGISKAVSNRGDYENLGADVNRVYNYLLPLYKKYNPYIYGESCFDKMKSVINEGVKVGGYYFYDTFFSSIDFYRISSEYFAVVTFNTNTQEGIHLAEGKKYIYCGLSLTDFDTFKYVDPIESNSQKFNRIIRNKRCNCE